MDKTKENPGLGGTGAKRTDDYRDASVAPSAPASTLPSHFLSGGSK